MARHLLLCARIAVKMLYYPQLSTGSISQFPIARRTVTRTVTNEMLGGDTIRMGDPNAALVQWQLQYSNLTDDEWSAIEELFETAEGQLNTFVFLDPTDNLLMWSEDWTQPVWSADPMLQVTGGAQDPLGGTDAMNLTNSAQTTQRIVQLTAGPSWFQYCFSVYLCSDSPAAIELVVTSNGVDALTTIEIGSAWQRAFTSSILAIQADGISFGLQLPAGTEIMAFGAQVEAQPAAGPYKKNIDLGGVYPVTRFNFDSLLRNTDAVNQNSGSVNLVSALT